MPAARAPRARRFLARRSPIHGRGVFACAPIAAGERIVEYKGKLISEREADRRYPDEGETPFHTFLFLLDGARVIDANRGGNSARWLNHSCEPNCESVEQDDGRVFIEAIRAISPGEELTYDYNFVLCVPRTKAVLRRFACRCGAAGCRGTMLAPGRRAQRSTGLPAGD